MIYCVVPRALAGDLYFRLVDYYAREDNVTVIIDRRRSERRLRGGRANVAINRRRVTRDRRRARIPGDLLPLAGLS
jgi:hypothetical protein